jgi:CxxC-x17-CxxC domain-containing protein
MHKIKCSDCGCEAEVPFKPTEGKPVYCRECFQKHRPPRRDRF